MEAGRREEHWRLLRESVRFLRENEAGCQQRKIKEVDRIMEVEKAERLAIASQKKKRYGIKTLNKEENKRIRERTAQRIEISQAKANYWKMHRGEKKSPNEEWMKVREGILMLEERGGWINKEDGMTWVRPRYFDS